ncbi:3,4-dihydroxy-2-butanone-4-phosphate synthase [Klebsiella pneumoniae]
MCLCLTEDRRKQLDLPMMVENNTSAYGTGFRRDHRSGRRCRPPASPAADRVTTVRAAIADGAKPSDLNRPGHVFPLRAQPGGVLTRGGHTEATIDLVTLAGFKPAGVLCELTNDDGTMARAPECIKFAQQHNMAVVTIEDLVAYRREHERKAS